MWLVIVSHMDLPSDYWLLMFRLFSMVLSRLVSLKFRFCFSFSFNDILTRFSAFRKIAVTRHLRGDIVTLAAIVYDVEWRTGHLLAGILLDRSVEMNDLIYTECLSRSNHPLRCGFHFGYSVFFVVVFSRCHLLSREISWNDWTDLINLLAMFSMININYYADFLERFHSVNLNWNQAKMPDSTWPIIATFPYIEFEIDFIQISGKTVRLPRAKRENSWLFA